MNYLFLSSLGKTPLEGQVLSAASAAADILKVRGLARVHFKLTFAMAAYNLIRLPKLLAIA